MPLYNWPGKYENVTPNSGFPFLIIFPSANSAGAPKAPLAKPPSQIRSGHNPMLGIVVLTTRLGWYAIFASAAYVILPGGVNQSHISPFTDLTLYCESN